MIDVNKISEGVDYELVPVEDSPNEQAWAVRILSGPYTESVIRYGNVGFNGDEHMTFNFGLDYSPDPDLTTEDVDFQDHVGTILLDIIERAIADGSLVTKERDGN